MLLLIYIIHYKFMNKFFKLVLSIALLVLIMPSFVLAQQSAEPLIVLQTEDTEVIPGSQIKYLVFYGNSSEESIKDAELVLDLFVDGDTNLQYVSSSQQIEWISSGDKRKPSWKIGTIETSDDVADLPYVVFKVAVNEAATDGEIIAARAYLYAPNLDEASQETYSSEIKTTISLADDDDDQETNEQDSDEQQDENDQDEQQKTQDDEQENDTEIISNQKQGEKKIQPVLLESETEEIIEEEVIQKDENAKLDAMLTLGVVLAMIVVALIIGIIIGFIFGVGKRRKYHKKQSKEDRL